MKYELVIPIEPKPKARPRATVIAGHASIYTPKETRVFEAKVAAIAAEHIKEPIRGTVYLRMKFYLARPKRLMRRSDPEGAVLCPLRPDLDNLEKSLIDGLTGIAFLDDSQVAEKYSAKLYHEKPYSPREHTIPVSALYDVNYGRPRMEIEINGWDEDIVLGKEVEY